MSDHLIPFPDAIEMTKRYRNNRDSILAQQEQGKNILPICETFDKAAIVQLLEQPNCAGFRIYYGMDTELKVHAILVGTDATGADILPELVYSGQAEAVENTGELFEKAERCPPNCPPASPLNEG
jgi:ABC-type dipeptide/oligopeptide/nickel transport system permease subunit